MKIFGIHFGNSSDSEASVPDALSKGSTIPSPAEKEVVIDVEIPISHLVETELRPLFNETPGLETVWKACLMWHVQFNASLPFVFLKDNIDHTEYRRYKKFYQTYVLEVEKPVLDEYLKLSFSNISFGDFVGFVDKALEYGDSEMLDTILIQAKRLFTESKFANDLLDGGIQRGRQFRDIMQAIVILFMITLTTLIDSRLAARGERA